MTPQQARRFGGHIRKARERLGMSSRKLANLAEISDSTIVRIEQGAFAEPDPEKLERIVGVLGLDRAEMYRLVDYEPPTELLSIDDYLSVRYPTLPAAARAEIDAHLRKLLRRHNINIDHAATVSTPGAIR
jgi:transcriptional regulator with XRE-family HTH domain